MFSAFTEALSTLTALSQLHIHGGNFTDEELPDALFRLTKLRRLHLVHSGIYGNLSRITALSKLSTLTIADGLRVYGIPEGISRLSSLQYFSYENNNLGAPSNIKGVHFLQVFQSCISWIPCLLLTHVLKDIYPATFPK